MTELDTWLICGNKVDPSDKHRGCTCTVNDPTERRSKAAIARRKREKETRERA